MLAVSALDGMVRAGLARPNPNWNEQDIDVGSNQSPFIPVQRLRIVGVIFALTKLSRVNKNRDNNLFRVLPGQINKTQMSGVQISHRGNQRDMIIVLAPLG